MSQFHYFARFFGFCFLILQPIFPCAIAFIKRPEIQSFYLLFGPGCFTQERQAGLYARVIPKALDFNATSEICPTVVGYQFFNLHFKGNAVQGVIFLGGHAQYYIL